MALTLLNSESTVYETFSTTALESEIIRSSIRSSDCVYAAASSCTRPDADGDSGYVRNRITLPLGIRYTTGRSVRDYEPDRLARAEPVPLFERLARS